MVSTSRIGRTIQEMRGMSPADRVQRYSAESYAAQYGITVEDVREYRDACETSLSPRRFICLFLHKKSTMVLSYVMCVPAP